MLAEMTRGKDWGVTKRRWVRAKRIEEEEQAMRERESGEKARFEAEGLTATSRRP